MRKKKESTLTTNAYTDNLMNIAYSQMLRHNIDSRIKFGEQLDVMRNEARRRNPPVKVIIINK
jgi:hypothetical protein